MIIATGAVMRHLERNRQSARYSISGADGDKIQAKSCEGEKKLAALE
jgi:hypothetical protein